MNTPLKITRLVVAFLLALTPAVPLHAAEEFFAKRPAFSRGDLPAERFARCEEVRGMIEGMPDPGYRIDLSVTGELTLVKGDGALWYLVMCRDVRIMCVTYQDNGMKVGDRVSFKGGWKRVDPNHAMLDPCLANAEP